MLALTALVASIGVADSINPSTLIPGLWLATTPATGRLASYTLGVFAVYTLGGLVLLFGPGRVLINALHHAHGPVEHVLEAVGGLLVLASRLPCGDAGARRPGHARLCPTAARPRSRSGPGSWQSSFRRRSCTSVRSQRSSPPVRRLRSRSRSGLLQRAICRPTRSVAGGQSLRRRAGGAMDTFSRGATAPRRAAALSGVAAVAGTALLAIGLGGLFVF